MIINNKGNALNNEYDEQAINFCEKTNTTIQAEFVGRDIPQWEERKNLHNHFLITLQRGKRSYTFDFWDSIYNTEKSIKASKDFLFDKFYPREYDILACIQKYDCGTFEEFCSEFGYDTDSRKAEKIYNACVKEFTALQTLYNDEEIEEMQEIQ